MVLIYTGSSDGAALADLMVLCFRGGAGVGAATAVCLRLWSTRGVGAMIGLGGNCAGFVGPAVAMGLYTGIRDAITFVFDLFCLLSKNPFVSRAVWYGFCFVTTKRLGVCFRVLLVLLVFGIRRVFLFLWSPHVVFVPELAA